MRTLARGVKAPPDLVTIVAIDDAIVKLGGAYPLPRAEIARIVEAIARLEPKVIAIDLLLVDKGPADGDAALAKSIAAHPTVLAAAAVFPNTVQPSAETDEPLARLPIADRFLLPLPAFSERAEVGIANVATGQTGTPLSVPMLFRTHDKIELSFPLRVASVAIGKPLTIEPDRLLFGDRPIATASDYALPISYYGPRRTIRTVSAANLIDGTIDKEAIQGRIVVLGATATGAGDFFPTPFDSLMPGVEIISTAITHLVAGDGVVRDGPVRVVEAITTILLPILLVGLLAWRRNAVGLLTVSAVMLAWAAANTVAFAHGIWLDTATTMAAAVPPVVLFGALQLWSGRRSAQHLAVQNRLLEQFQTPGLQEWLTRDPDFLLAPVRQNAAVVFVDLSGFTSLSETLDPDATRGLLKEFHALVDKEVTRCGGMITSFLGDGAMILFGLPEAAPDDAARAAQCSIALCVKTERWIEALPPPIAVADRLQDRRAFRTDRRLPARRPQPSAHHRNRRHREHGEPSDGSGSPPRCPAGAERYLAHRGGAHRRPAENRKPCRPRRDADSRPIRLAHGLAVAGRTSHDGSTHASRRRGVTGRAPYRCSGGGVRSSTSTLGPSSRSSA